MAAFDPKLPLADRCPKLEKVQTSWVARASDDDVPEWQVYLIALAGVAILIGLSMAGIGGWVQLYAVTFVAAVIVTSLFWKDRANPWFWSAVLGLAAVQLLVITLAYPANAAPVAGPLLLPVEFADFSLFYSAAWFAQRRR